MKDFGKWDEGRWRWVINLTRRVSIEGTIHRVIWVASSSERFSCRFFRRLISLERQATDRWKVLWAMPVLLKDKCFVWLLFKDRIAVRSMLQKLGIIQDDGSVCPICGDGREYIMHLFFHCDHV